MEMNIVIVGAGLGGLGTALALKIAAPSINVLVLEAAAELAEVSRLHNPIRKVPSQATDRNISLIR